MFKKELKFFSESYAPHKKLVAFVILGSLAAAGVPIWRRRAAKIPKACPKCLKLLKLLYAI